MICMTWIQRDQRKLFSKDVRYMQLHILGCMLFLGLFWIRNCRNSPNNCSGATIIQYWLEYNCL